MSTLVGPLSSMHSHMSFQIIWLSTWEVTLITLEGLLSSMHSHMSLQTTWPGASVITMITAKGLVSSLSSDTWTLTSFTFEISLTPCGPDLDVRRSYIVGGGFFFSGLFFYWLRQVFRVLTSSTLAAHWDFIEVFIPRMLDDVAWKMASELLIRCQNFFRGYQRNTWPAIWIYIFLSVFSKRELTHIVPYSLSQS